MSLALPDASPLEPGTRLDRYELLCPIAHGGMASVWIARLTGKHGFEKLFAVKTILPQYASDLRFQQMFLDEARIASSIDHANVAHIIDLGEEGEVLYLVMEWVDGDSLSKLNRAVHKKGRRLPVGIVLRILADICGGLHAAHEMRTKDGHLLGVVHRDVSPQNILINTTGIAKLIDFGVAKARDRVAGETSAGQLKGKIHYMAPEQALGRSVDRRADVWSVGAVAYHLLGGAPPFDGANELATLHMLTSGKSPPPLPDHVPIAVADPIFRALVDNIEERIPTALEMQRALEQAMVDAGVMTTAADVAQFTTQYLADRIESRRRAIDKALLAASTRTPHPPRLKPAPGDSASGVDHMVSQVKEASSVSAAFGSQAPPPMHPSTAPGIGPHSGNISISPSGYPPGYGEISSPGSYSSGGAGTASAPGSSSASGAGQPSGLVPATSSVSGLRPPTPPNFVVDFAPPVAAPEPSSHGSEEVAWPPPGIMGKGWPRWALWGAAGGLLVFSLLVTLFAFHRKPEGEAAATPVADTATTAAPEPSIPPPPTDTSATAAPTSSASHAGSASVAGSLPPLTTPTPTPTVTKSTGRGGGYHPPPRPPPSPPPAATAKKNDYGF